MVRSKDAILRDRAEVFSHVPDADRTPGRIIETAGGPGLLDRPCSPERILFFWFFKEAVFDRYRFEDRGWEDVEGHPCRKVSFHVDVGPAHARREEVFWIDLERGGHPLRMDVLQGGQLASRTHSIRLEQTHPSDGAVFWLPRSGITESYSWNGNLRREPVFREAYHVVKGSVRINRGYPDRVFTARWDGTVAGASALDPARRAFTAALAQQPASDPPPRTDPEGVAEELERRLAEADSQAAMIEVSNSARVEWWRTLVAQGLAIGLGGALIGVAILLRRRA